MNAEHMSEEQTHPSPVELDVKRILRQLGIDFSRWKELADDPERRS